MQLRLLATSVLASVALYACSDNEAAKREYLANGNRLFAGGKYAEATVEYRNALKIDDRFGEARAQLGEAYAAMGNPEGAYREYMRAADLMPDNLEVQKRAATLLFMAGQFEDVRTRAEAVLRKNPKDLDAQILLANAMVGLKDLEGGVREIEEAVQLDPEHAATYTNLALVKLAQGKSQAALEAFEKAVQIDPKSLKARLALTYFHLASGNAAQSEAALTEALKLDPKDPLANRTLATLLIGTGRHAQAEKPLKLVVEVTGSARAKFALADYYLQEGRVPDARALLEPMAKSADTYADAQTRLASIVFAEGKPDDAAKQLDDVLKRYPSHPLALQARARAYLASGRPVQALDRARTAVAAAPRDIGALYLLGTLQAQSGQHEAATTSFNQVLKFNPRAAAAQVQLSQISLLRGDNETAIGLAREAVKGAPGVPEARLVLARALVADRDFARAEVEINQLLRAYPDAAAVHAIRGTLYLMKGEAPTARTAYQTALALSPDSIAALTGLTMLDMQEQRLPAARARVDARIAAGDKRAGLLVLAAKVYLADKDLTKAEQVLRQAIVQAPALPAPYSMLVEIYRAQGRLDGARAEFDALIQRDGSNISARTMAATLMHAQNNASEAKRRYAELLQLEPRAVIAANNLAWIYADERQNLDAALELAERATEQLPEYAEAWDTLGWVYYRKQLPLLAIDPFEKAIAKEPGNAMFHYHLGLALIGGGDRARAREALEAALKIQPAFPDALREMKALQQ